MATEINYKEARTEWNSFCDEYVKENVFDKDVHLFSEGGFQNEFWYGYAEKKNKTIATQKDKIEELKQTIETLTFDKEQKEYRSQNDEENLKELELYRDLFPTLQSMGDTFKLERILKNFNNISEEDLTKWGM